MCLMSFSIYIYKQNEIYIIQYIYIYIYTEYMYICLADLSLWKDVMSGFSPFLFTGSSKH